MANRQQRRTAANNKPKLHMTPEQREAAAAEQSMERYIKEHGIDAMVEKQIEWKLNDVNLKLIAASNIKAWFETRGEVIDVWGSNTTMDIVDRYNDFKRDLYKNIAETYKAITPDQFGEDFVNPFVKIWETFEDRRGDMFEAMEELYAWTILEDPVQWASQLNYKVKQHLASSFKEEEEEEKEEE